MARNLYEVLGVDKGADQAAIRKSYRKLARKYHPDVNPGDKSAEERFKEISAAYEALSDDAKRKAYDEFGEDALRGGFDADKAREYKRWQGARSAGGVPFDREVVDYDLGDLSDLFAGFNRGGGARRGRRTTGPLPGQDVRAVVELDLRQALSGFEMAVEVPAPGGAPEQVKVRIPPGADDGSTLRVPGKGAPGHGGGPRGDLVIETRVRPHPRVRREGMDLHMRLPVTLGEAYNGAQIDVPTFDGTVKVRVPARSQPGQKLRLKEKGVHRKDRHGDMYLELEVHIPDREDAALAEALSKADALYERPVRSEVIL